MDYTELSFSMAANFSRPCSSMKLNLETMNNIKSVLWSIYFFFFYSHLGFANFKFLFSIIEDCSVRSTGADETDTLKAGNSINTEPKNNKLTGAKIMTVLV